MTFLGIHHSAIICSDYQRSKRFYTEILGFTIIHEVYREARQSYKLDLAVGDDNGGQIELFSFPSPPERPSHPEACGLRHLAFRVASVKETVEELEGNDVAVEPVRQDPYTGKLFTFFQDPDGLPLEIYQQ